MDLFGNDSMAKALEEKQDNAAIEAEMAGTTEEATQPAGEENTTEGDKAPAPLGLLGKRAGESGPTEIQPEVKKQKLNESITSDVANAAPPQADVFNAPRTPPGTSKAIIVPFTPMGKQPLAPNPIYTPARPPGVSRIIKDDEEGFETDDSEDSQDSQDSETDYKDKINNGDLPETGSDDEDWDIDNHCEKYCKEEYEEDDDLELENGEGEETPVEPETSNNTEEGAQDPRED